MTGNTDSGSDANDPHSPQPSSADEALRRQQEDERVEGCLARDRPYFDRLETEYIEWVRAGAAKAIQKVSAGVSCEAEDLVQEFYMVLWREPKILERFNSHQGPLGPWLRGVAYRWSLKFLHSRGHSSEVSWPGPVAPEIDVEHLPIPEPAAPPLNAPEIVAKILAHLSSTTGDIVQARYGLGKYPTAQSVAEIAQRKGMSKSKVYQCLARIRRVRKWLRLEDFGTI